MIWVPMTVTAGGKTGTIFIDSKAQTQKSGDDLIITYTAQQGGLSFTDPEGRAEYADNPPIWANARILAVGGGGGGGMIGTRGSGGGAGGGAGGFVEGGLDGSIVFDNIAAYSITVGRGGAGGDRHKLPGKNGGASSVTKDGVAVIPVAQGGGGGGAHSAGLDGGSGGGASRRPVAEGGDTYGGAAADGQGFPGGDGNDSSASFRGAGGGGAGGKGGDAADMYGGAGKSSDITGVSVFYAGGGGGAYVNLTSELYEKYLGGAGGVGGGGNGAGVDGGESGKAHNPVPAQNGVDGLGGGGGGAVSHDGADEVAGNGGSGVVIIRLSGFVVKNVPIPKTTNYVFDGHSKTGVVEFFAYELTGTPIADNADVYTVTAKIKPQYPFEWDDPEGGQGERKLVWHIAQMSVTVPTVTPSYVYDSFVHYAVDPKKYLIDADNYCHLTNAGLDHAYCKVEGNAETEANSYTVTISLSRLDFRGNPATNYVWRTPQTMDDQLREWRITQAPNAIRDFDYPCRNLARLERPLECFTCDWPKKANMRIGENVIVEYRPVDDEEGWTDWGSATSGGPKEKGSYIIRVKIPETDNWQGDEVEMEFGTWNKPSDIFSDQVTFKLSGFSGSTSVSDLPVPVVIREPERDGYSPYSGFEYARAGQTGRDIQFFSSSGDPIPHDVERWNPHGDSLVWVKVPTANSSTTIMMCWKRNSDIYLRPYDGGEVWRGNYEGVWHMSELNKDNRFPDATGNGHDAYLTNGSTWEKLDTADGAPAAGAIYLKSGYLFVDNDIFPEGTTSNAMTYAGFYKSPDFVTGTTTEKGYKVFAGLKYDARKDDTAKIDETKTWPGWALRMHNAANRVMLEATGTEFDRNGIGWSINTGWGCLGAVFGTTVATGTGAKLFYGTPTVSFTAQTAATYFMNGVDKPLQLATGGFCVDEVRISKKVLGDAFISEAANAVAKSQTYCVLSGSDGLVRIDCDRYNDGKGLICDWWRTEPELKPTMWKKGEKGTLSVGAYQSGASVGVDYVNRTNGVSFGTTQPTEIGFYSAILDHQLSTRGNYRPQPYSIDFYIIEPARKVEDLGGSASGRILLMNADNRAEGPVTNQGWAAQAPEGTVTYWRHSGEMTGTNNILPGTSSTLYRSADNEALWTLVDCRHGNTFPTNDMQGLNSAYCFLPPSSATALSATNETEKATRSTTGWIMMRNVLDACVYSPVYSNGIGTIYFDALNSRRVQLNTAATNAYRFVVETTTNVVANLTDLTDDDWEARTILSTRFAGTITATDQPATEELALCEITGGATARYYRMHVPVAEQLGDLALRPIRFRIRRTGIDEERADDKDDSFILVDNLIASFPVAQATLQPYGRFDESTDGRTAVGFGCAFDIPFPSVADGASLTGRCTVAIRANEEFSGLPVGDLVSMAQMFYRWRYLGQDRVPAADRGTAWNVVALEPVGDRALRATAGLDVPALPGDVEFYFAAVMKGDYYKFVDYTGNGWPVDKDGYSEEAGLVETHRERKTVLPTGAADWYVRLRDGRSPYEGVALYTQTAEDGPIATNRLELTADGQWTGRIRIEQAAAGGLRYRLSGLNPQAFGSTEYAFSHDDWQGAASADKLPVTLDVSDGNAWRTVPCDAATDYLFFQLDETKRRLMCAHCEWQDFSLWSSAVNADGLYVGNAADTNATSTAAKEYDMFKNGGDGWAASQSTSPNWTEDFKVTTGQVAAVVYPRNKPFATATSRNGWQVENAMWTYAKWSLQNNPDPAKSFGDDSAVQLQGRGTGSLAFMNGDIAPDGLDSIRYTARVAQYNEFADFTYFDTYLIKDDESLPLLQRIEPTRFLKDTTVVAHAALTESGSASYDGDGSISLVNYYDAAEGCYEFRVSRGTGDTDLRLALFRWRLKNGSMVCEPLTEAKNWFDFNADNKNPERGSARLVKVLKNPLGGLFLSAMEDGGKTLITAGVCEADVDTFTGPTGFSGRKFTCITYHDNAGERLTHGSFGVLACNCPGVFVKPICYRAGVSSFKPSKVGELQSGTAKVVTFTGNIVDIATVKQAANWVVKKGRTEALTGHTDCYGWQAKPVLPQKVAVEICKAGTGAWQGVVTNTVSGFTDYTFTTKVRNPGKCNVRLKGVGTIDDVRTDIVVNDVQLSQWNGQWTPNYNVQSPFSYLKDEFVYTAAWIKEDASGLKSVLLQPARATYDSNGGLRPVSVRTPMMRGLGLFHFRWRNAESHAKLKVQVNEIVTEGNIVRLTESIAGSGQAAASWETVAEVELNGRPEGSMTVPINRRYHGQESGRDYYFGMVRIVVDEEVERTALSGGRPVSDDRYGQVEILEAYAWDLPEYDRHSWTGWNFRAAGWDGEAPDEFANLTDGLRGLSGILNNTLDVSTLADREKSHYQAKPPHVQSPVFRTNCVGAVTFKARLFRTEDAAEHPSVVSIYGTRTLDSKGEPVEGSWDWVADVEVTNRFYETFSVKMKANDGYKAVRLGVRGVAGVIGEGGKAKYEPPHRVAIDDICLWERSASSIAFRGTRVRPFRDATAIKGTGAVLDIEDISEQPLAAESFGFQAEVVVEDDEEVLVDDPAHPITVDLWYYAPPAGEQPVWGFDNWRTNAAAVRVPLRPATGTNLVFRSTVDVSASMCPPQFLAEGEPYRLVQYHMVAHFYHQGGEQDEHELQRTEWVTPEWYLGFPDPNEAGKFSAFTLIERLAPRRAWINEVNFVEETVSATRASQWIEIAVPSGEDMTGWKLDLYDYEGNLVSALGTFGQLGWANAKTYRGNSEIAAKSHYAFYTVKGPYTVMDKSQYDGVWRTFNGNGVLEYNRPYALTLSRPTGVVEHRVVVQGKNEAVGKYWYWYKYEGTNLVEVMRDKFGGTWTWSAEDFKERPGDSVGVVTNQGALHAEWVSPMAHTPSEINVGQYIDPDWLIRPNGGYVWIYSTVLGDHLRQVIGGVTNTAGSVTVQEGSSTNIQYIADRWYELASCEVTPPDRTQLTGPVSGKDGERIWTLNMNLVSNRLDIVAKSGVDQAVQAFGATPDNPYTPAIMRWLREGVTGGADGGRHPFKNPDGPLKPMHYRGTNGTTDEELKFPDMYWLDVDPTAGGWELWGGMGEKGGTEHLGRVDEPVYRTRILEDGTKFIHTNHQTTVWMELRNDEEGVSYPPYRLQGLGNEQSDQWTGAWTSATFKVTMALKNGKVDDVFQPMRYFVFDWGSFRPADDAEAPFAARIEVIDPFSNQSPAADWGWKPYWMDPVMTSWALDGRISPEGVSTLKKDDLLGF